ncbi:cytochrome P450 [Thozetella sp. PMI_491]|nr:cytochrome P450 [Thozetella sp. PMI_491]
MDSSLLLIIGLAALPFAVFMLKDVGRRPKDYPPGPPTLPLIGNLHLMPTKRLHAQFQKWAEQYGPVYSLLLGTKTAIVLTSDKVIKDLLDKRSNIYSSRPEMYLGSDIASGGLRVALMKYGDTWRMERKLLHGLLNIKAASSYVAYQDLESKQMLHALLTQPDLFSDHVGRYTGSLTTQIVYGFRTSAIDDPKLLQLFHGFNQWSELVASQTAALLDLYPILRRLPNLLLPERQHAQGLFKEEKELYLEHWMAAKRKAENGTLKPCFCAGLLDAQGPQGFTDDQAAYIAGTALEAGTDTTANTLVGFIQAMVLYPEVQKAGQEVVDRFYHDEMPEIADMDHPDLQYIRACAKETLRWMPTAPLGIPHSVIQNDTYAGYKIPKDSTIFTNIWGIHRDAKRFPNPAAFDPSRYAHDTLSSSESTASVDPGNRDHFGFGAGRRICPGMHVADRSMFLGIARMLWAFNFEKAKDAEGHDITPVADDLTEGLAVGPVLFPAKITPRSAIRAQKVTEAWEQCQELLDEEKEWKKIPDGMAFVKAF